MNNFNPMGFLNNFTRNLLQNTQTARSNAPLNTQNTQAQNFNNTPMYIATGLGTTQQKGVSPELKMTPMEVEQSAKYVKELLNLPKDIATVISQMVSQKSMTTAQNVQLLMLLSSGKIDLNQLSALLGDNSKIAMQKLVQVMSDAARAGIKDQGQLKELINTLGAISVNSNDPSSALKNFILLYLPWLPINEKGETRDFDIDVFDATANSDGTEGLQSITILIQTMNFSNVKVILEEQQSGQIEIMMNCVENFPKEKVLDVLKQDAQELNIKAGLSVEVTKEQISKDTVKNIRAEISSSPTVSPQLMLMAHSVIKIVFRIDKGV